MGVVLGIFLFTPLQMVACVPGSVATSCEQARACVGCVLVGVGHSTIQNPEDALCAANAQGATDVTLRFVHVHVPPPITEAWKVLNHIPPIGFMRFLSDRLDLDMASHFVAENAAGSGSEMDPKTDPPESRFE